MTACDRIRFALATALVAAGCGGGEDDPLVGGPFEGVDFDHAMTNVRELVSTAGIRRATVLGDTAYVYEESGSTEIVGVRVTMYDERGAQTGSSPSTRPVGSRTRSLWSTRAARRLPDGRVSYTVPTPAPRPVATAPDSPLRSRQLKHQTAAHYLYPQLNDHRRGDHMRPVRR